MRMPTSYRSCNDVVIDEQSSKENNHECDSRASDNTNPNPICIHKFQHCHHNCDE